MCVPTFVTSGLTLVQVISHTWQPHTSHRNSLFPPTSAASFHMYVCLFPVLINRSVAAAFLSSPVFFLFPTPLHIHLSAAAAAANWSDMKLITLSVEDVQNYLGPRSHLFRWQEVDDELCSVIKSVIFYKLVNFPKMSSEKGDRIFCIFFPRSVIDRDW